MAMYLLLYTNAVLLSAIAAYYSVIGLVAIFAAAAVPVAVMGGSLEIAKLVIASWLYRYWRDIPVLMRMYFVSALMILMLITSMGIFGYLSKAHLDQAVPTGDVVAKVAILDEKIKTQKDNIESARKALTQMDSAVDQTMARSTSEQGADKAASLRRAQQKERGALQNDIGRAQKEIAKLNEERAPIATELRKVEAEVGPIKYIAALLFGDNPDVNNLERAVRWLIIILICVFDPLAVLMLIAANLTQIKNRQWRKEKAEADNLTAAAIPAAAVVALDEVPNDTKLETIPDPVELPVAVEPAVEQEAHGTSEKDAEANVVQGTEVEAVGDVERPGDYLVPPVEEKSILEQHPYLNNGFVHFEGLTPIVATPLEDDSKKNLVEVTEQKQEDTYNEEEIVKPESVSIDTQVEQLIESGDETSLEAVYKKIVKELGKKNRAKTTHWGPIKTPK